MRPVLSAVTAAIRVGRLGSWTSSVDDLSISFPLLLWVNTSRP